MNTLKHVLAQLRVTGATTKATITILDASPYGETFQITDADGNVRTFAVNDAEVGKVVIGTVQTLDRETK